MLILLQVNSWMNFVFKTQHLFWPDLGCPFKFDDLYLLCGVSIKTVLNFRKSWVALQVSVKWLSWH